MKKIYLGLGGIGGQIIEQLADVIDDSNTEFINIDVERELKKQNNKTRFIDFRTPASVIDILNVCPEMRKWMPRSPLLKDCVACNDRILGRLYFERYLKQYNILETLGFENIEGDIEVNIVSTAFGNTGSGILLHLLLLMHKFFIETNMNYDINLFIILPEFIETLIPSKIEKKINMVKTYAFLREIYALNKIFAGEDNLERIELDGFIDYKIIQQSKKKLYKHICFSCGGKNSNNYIEKNNYLVDAICKYNSFGDFSMFDINETTSSNLILDASKNYRTEYDEYVSSVKQESNLHITPHIDKQWHEILPAIE